MFAGEIQIMKIRTIQRLKGKKVKGGKNLNVRKKTGRAQVVRQNHKIECKARKEEVMIKERNRGRYEYVHLGKCISGSRECLPLFRSF